MGRPRKYASDEERHQARKSQKLAWFHRNSANLKKKQESSSPKHKSVGCDKTVTPRSKKCEGPTNEPVGCRKNRHRIKPHKKQNIGHTPTQSNSCVSTTRKSPLESQKLVSKDCEPLHNGEDAGLIEDALEKVAQKPKFKTDYWVTSMRWELKKASSRFADNLPRGNKNGERGCMANWFLSSATLY
ncbi:hypothetical protein SCHPADRAFT_909318 [Schizopora paradoxa]|uniref:Uncharacterized protein n=1 Tax=Schizopora paradoxa TaxID=27342 RepID=A0A0H2RDJ8_9AGAM|nr:hypothetical protein SCHPADRAFT_909318 [Schizopora paradoxa]